ncbi:hypothetical protein J6590_069612 [Homalodisca vitripennis]|nr:hypothetical protein J6590_069612 [Homalodisca vitripennis]
MIVHANGPQASEMMKPKPFRQLPNTWNLLKPIQGRAIVKGNNTFSVPPPVVPSGVDYMSMSQQFKTANVQRNKLPQSGGNPAQQFMLGMNRGGIQPQTNTRGKYFNCLYLIALKDNELLNTFSITQICIAWLISFHT